MIEVMRSPNCLQRAALCALALLCLIQCLQYLSHLPVDDDTLLSAYLSERLRSPSAATALEGEYLAILQATPGCEVPAWRFEFRNRYAGNYLLFSGAEAAVRDALQNWSDGDEDLLVVATAMTVRAGMLLICWAVLAWTIYGLGRTDVRTGALSGLALVLALDILLRCGLAVADQHHWISDPGFLPIRLLRFLRGNSPFEHTPRNAAIILFFAAMLFKWANRPMAAVAVVLAIAGIHQTYAGFALALLTALMLLSSRSQLQQPRIRLLLTLAAFIYIARERYWGDLGPQAFMAAGLSALVFWSVLWFAASPRFERIWSKLGLPEFRSATIADGAILLVLVLVVSVVSLLAYFQVDDVLRAGYFWRELPPRLGSLCLLPLSAALMAFLGKREILPGTWRVGPAAGMLACVAVLLLGSLSLAAIDRTSLRERAARANALSAASTAQLFEPVKEEARLYSFLYRRLRAPASGQAEIDALTGGREVQCNPGRMPPTRGEAQEAGGAFRGSLNRAQAINILQGSGTWRFFAPSGHQVAIGGPG